MIVYEASEPSTRHPSHPTYHDILPNPPNHQYRPPSPHPPPPPPPPPHPPNPHPPPPKEVPPPPRPARPPPPRQPPPDPPHAPRPLGVPPRPTARRNVHAPPCRHHHGLPQLLPRRRRPAREALRHLLLAPALPLRVDPHVARLQDGDYAVWGKVARD